jgi:uncharacterized protein YggT (Ycf19 family)
VLGFLLQLDLLHWLVQIVFWALIISLWAKIILSWLTMVFLRPDAPIIRFFDQITGPMIEPLRRRLPTMSAGMFDVGFIIAFLVVFWSIYIVRGLILNALPLGW